LTPSSWNWTPATVREPTIVTLALTVIVRLTVDPEVGDVTETIRLPSCADTLGAKNNVEPRITSRTVAEAHLTTLIPDAGVLALIVVRLSEQ